MAIRRHGVGSQVRLGELGGGFVGYFEASLVVMDSGG